MSQARTMWRGVRLTERPRVDTDLKKYLQARDISMSEFARRCELPMGQISMYAHGRVVPTLVNALRIEWATDGLVSCESWLKLPAMRTHWEGFTARMALAQKHHDAVKLRCEKLRQQRQARYFRHMAEDPFFRLEDPYGPQTEADEE